MLVSKDWGHEPVLDSYGVQQVSEKTGKPVTKAVHLGTFAKMKPVDLFLFDEVHMIQNRKSRSKRTVYSIKSDWKVALSGTFYGNSFVGAWAVARWLWRDLIPASFYAWVAEWCETVYDPFAFGNQKVVGEKVAGAFVASLPLYFRAEATEEAPAPRVVLVDLTPEQRRDYESLERDMVVWLKSQTGVEPLIVDLPITLRARLRTATLGTMSLDADGEIFFPHDTKSSKLDALSKLLHEYGKQPVIIGVDSKRFAKVTVARMKAGGLAVAEWSGDVNSKGRDAIKAAFLAGELQYIVSVIPSMSTGIDGLQGVCSKVVWLSQSDDLSQNTQWLARTFRPGRTMQYGEFEHTVIQARETLDLGIFNKKASELAAQNDTLRYVAELPIAA